LNEKSELFASEVGFGGMEYKRWGWLLTALALIGLGVTIAIVVQLPA
jgi:hypothetical protein